MLKKLTLSIFMLTCVMAASAAAQTQSSSEKQASIKELVQLINGDNRMEDMMNAMATQMQASQDAAAKSLLDARTDLTAADRRAIEDALANDKKYSYKRFYDKLTQKLNYTELMNEISAGLFDKYYTHEEIKELVAFYKSPIGQKSIKMTPAVAADTMQAIQEKLMPKMMNVLKEIQDEDHAEIVQKINAKKPAPKKTPSGK